MFFNFAGRWPRLPIVDVTTITFASPLITVALSALGFLKERVRILSLERGRAVGFIGVVVMLWPASRPRAATTAANRGPQTLGALFRAGERRFTNAGLGGCRRAALTDTETTSSIVLYSSIFCALGRPADAAVRLDHAEPAAARRPDRAWRVRRALAHPADRELTANAPASLVAPLDYTALLWAFIIGYWFFGELPTADPCMSAPAIVAGSGLVRDSGASASSVLERARGAPPAEGPADRDVITRLRRPRRGVRFGHSGRRSGRRCSAPSSTRRSAAAPSGGD